MTYTKLFGKWCTVLLIMGSVFGASSAEAKKLIKANQLEKVEVGMSKDELKKAIGSPQEIRGVITNKYQQNIEIWQYKVKPAVGMMEQIWTPRETYHFYFLDNHLLEWIKMQVGYDWKKEQEKIFQTKFEKK